MDSHFTYYKESWQKNRDSNVQVEGGLKGYCKYDTTVFFEGEGRGEWRTVFVFIRRREERELECGW